MNGKFAWGLAICLVCPLCVGCANSPGVIRGQSPDGVQQAGHHLDQGSTVYAGADVCPECGCRDGHCGHRHGPTHRLWYHYQQPQNLVYPPSPSPAAVVQYPYYTCKGPDDFFHQD